ncbi:cupin domain-containing protein, partial [Clostridioides difficile]|uniref:cupin domain-containing protein n=1 Tax=Clostridioides difficile TaxID=1496 RepID=UPI000BCE8511
MRGQRKMCIRASFKPNQVLNAHRHPNGEQIFVFLKGEGKMKLGEHECDVKTAILYLLALIQHL